MGGVSNPRFPCVVHPFFKSGFLGSTNLLDVVIGEGAAVLKLLAGKDKALLVGRNTDRR